MCWYVVRRTRVTFWSFQLLPSKPTHSLYNPTESALQILYDVKCNQLVLLTVKSVNTKYRSRFITQMKRQAEIWHFTWSDNEIEHHKVTVRNWFDLKFGCRTCISLLTCRRFCLSYNFRIFCLLIPFLKEVLARHRFSL